MSNVDVDRNRAPVREELALLARLAAEACQRDHRRHPELPELHLGLCLLGDAVNAHLDRKEALLFPSLRFLESGEDTEALDVHALVRELLTEQEQIDGIITELRSITHDFVPPACSPLVSTLFAGTADVARRLAAEFHVDTRMLFPRALALQPRRQTTAPEM